MCKRSVNSFNMRRCENYPAINGYVEVESWCGDKITYIIDGDVGCEMWSKRTEEISKTGRISGTIEEGGLFGYQRTKKSISN